MRFREDIKCLESPLIHIKRRLVALSPPNLQIKIYISFQFVDSLVVVLFKGCPGRHLCDILVGSLRPNALPGDTELVVPLAEEASSDSVAGGVILAEI